jgi:hypothetical protein
MKGPSAMITIDHAQVPGYNPNQYEPHTESLFKKVGKWMGEHKILTGGSAVGAAGLAAAFLIHDTGKEAPISLHDVAVNPVASAPEIAGQGIDYTKIDPATLTVDQFYDDATYPEQYRIQWADKIIQERTTPELIEEINELLKGDHRDPITMPVPASVNNTGDQILTQQTVAGYIASTTTIPDEGRKLLAGFLSRENPGFNSAENQLGGGQKPVLATYYVAVESNNYSQKMESPVFTQIAIGDYIPNGTPSKLMTIMNSFDGKVSQTTEKFEDGRWIVANTINFPDSNWVAHPSQISTQ